VGRLIVEREVRGGDTSPVEAGTADLLGLIDRLEDLLHRSALDELEVSVGETTLVLRTPAAVAPPFDPRSLAAAAAAAEGDARYGPGPGGSPTATADRDGVLGDGDVAEADTRHAVLAPLTGVYYASPSPDAAPYVRVGAHVQQGQVIGLIEAMKLFNEIKSDATGSVTRIVAESGTLVKAKAPLIELETA
jgi:acetyl-CoA carboxylase biotin carboxyl carrier protein